MDTDELTRSNSEASSLTTEIFKDILQHKADKIPCKRTAWTNEKHDQYLNRLEASFVKQLHWSMGRLAGCSEQSKNARNLLMKQPANTASEQFTVLRDGCWQKINYGKTTAVGSHDVLRSPRVKHCKRAGGPCSTRSADLHERCKIQQEENLLREQTTSSHRERCPEDLPVNYRYYCGSVGSDAEGSGQNFSDEDREDDSKCRIKKLKTAVADTSSGDQMVPSGKLLAKNNSASGDVALEEEQARHQSPSEDYRSFAYPQPALRSFLRGS